MKLAAKLFLPALILTVPLFAQTSDSDAEREWRAHTYQMAAHTTRAVDYKQGSTSKVDLRGTTLMPDVSGEAEIKTKTGRAEIKAKLEHLNPANSIDLSYLTYVLWAISPDGHPSNIGELVVKDGKAEIETATPMQAFALIVTAEPYYAVSQPGDEVIAENVVGKDAKGSISGVDVSYELIPRAAYAEQAEPLQKPVYGMDEKTPLSLLEARNAVRIAKSAGAEEYASSAFQNAQQSLNQAEDYYQRKQSTKSIDTVARAAVQSAETARVTAYRAEQKAHLEHERAQQAQRVEDARARSEEATAQATQAQQQALQAQQARQRAENQAQQAQQQAQLEAQQRRQLEAQQQAAAQQSAQAQADADRARQQAQLEAQQRAAAEQNAQQAQLQAQQAQQQAQQAQQQAQQAQQQVAQTRAQLLSQLNQVLETRDSARGLIVSMPDVLFDTGKADLKPGARERLARVTGILIAYPDIHIEVDGHTDSTGTPDFNQQLSQERAAAVRDYMTNQGVPAASITAQGFGQDAPVASNDTAAGRQQNRRVELVVTGQSIGAQGQQ